MKKIFTGFVRKINASRITNNALQAIPFWFASLVVGLLAVLYTRLFGFAEELLHDALKWRSWSLFILTPLCFLFAWLLVRLLAPGARGSGIPQVMAGIEMAPTKHEGKISALLSLKILIVKIFSSVLMVLGGGAIGREGPTIQIAGSAFYTIRRWLPASWPKLSIQAFILTGAAAGLAAAFNTPLGGVVFAVEELAKIHIRFFRTALFSAVIIAGLTAQAFLGSYLYLGYPDVKNLAFSTFFVVGAVSVLSGMGGALMGSVIIAFSKWKKKFSSSQSFLFLLFVGFAFAATAVYLNDDVLGSGHHIMNGLLFTGDKHVSFETLVLRIVGPVLCFNVGAAGGIFAPALTAGATIGSYFSYLFDFAGANANILILAGMVGFLTGVTRTPFTSAILVLEMTDRHSVIFHLLLAAMISNIAAILIDRRSVYDWLKDSYLKELEAQDEKKTAGAPEPPPPATAAS